MICVLALVNLMLVRRIGSLWRRAMSRRPGFLVYGLLVAFVLGSAAPFYWSFLLGSQTAEIAAQGVPPLLPGGHFLDNAQRAIDTIPFWKALANSLLVSSIAACSVVVLRHAGRLRVRQAALPRQRRLLASWWPRWRCPPSSAWCRCSS